jgi:hypothetical protein
MNASLGLIGEILCQIPIFAKIMNEFCIQTLFGPLLYLHLEILINFWLIMGTIHYPQNIFSLVDTFF